ncbi:obscurin-like [Melanerpes formicivorus]|uniref:obscurin-like n=1 Tax=Melanerpes formicivorus TaxID=211600 RepID=UPI00358FDBCF
MPQEEQSISMVKELCDEDVTEPEEATLEWETSTPSVKPPRWLLCGEALQAGRNIIMQQEGTSPRLTVLQTSASVTGTVQLPTGKSKATANLLVRDSHIQITRKLEDKRALEHHLLILACDFRPSPKSVKWFKEHTATEPSEKSKIKQEQHSAELRVLKVKPEDAGVSKGRAGNAETEATLPVEGLNIGITKGLKNTGIQEGADCTFECLVSHESIADFSWTLPGSQVESGGRSEASAAGQQCTLPVGAVAPGDAGEVILTAPALTSKASLGVKEKPPEAVKQLEDRRAAAGQDISLSWELSEPDAAIRWYKDGKAIRKSQKCDWHQEGTGATLIIHEPTAKARGKYPCETEASKAKARITVQEQPNYAVQELSALRAAERGTAVLIGQSQRAASSVVWREGTAELRATKQSEITEKGQMLQLAINDLEKSDSDTSPCAIGDAQSRAKLVVQGVHEIVPLISPAEATVCRGRCLP